jgi:hypothetical protein
MLNYGKPVIFQFRNRWYCGFGPYGYGSSPAEAYHSWVRQMP